MSCRFHCRPCSFLYAVTKSGNKRWQVERSTDRGEAWQPLGREIPYSTSEIDTDPRNPDRVYAATYYGGIWVYDGNTWTGRGEADALEKDFFGAMVFQRLAVDPRQPNVIYAGQNHCWRGTARRILGL